MDLPEQERLFFEAVGRAFGQWQHVEMQLFRVYVRLVRPNNAEVASAAFSFGNKLQCALRHDQRRRACGIGGRSAARHLEPALKSGRQTSEAAKRTSPFCRCLRGEPTNTVRVRAVSPA